MPQVEKLLVFLASPGDVSTERRYVGEVVADLNRTVASDKGVVLQVVSWENDAFPGYGQDAQAIINEQIAEMSKYALFVGIMWNRLGTPTSRATSGTVEEFERAVQASKQNGQPEIWFYFRESASKMDTEEQLEQRGKVLAFKKEVQANGLPWTYKSPTLFREKFRQQMILWLNARTERNRTQQEARAQRTAEKAPIREQERKSSEAEAGRKVDEDKRKRIEEDGNYAAEETGQRLAKRQVGMATLSELLGQPEVKLEPGAVFHDKLKDGSEGPEMVVIPAGTFQMGDIHSDGKEFERPVHTVQIITPFAMGRYQVTFEEYDRFANATGRGIPDNSRGWGRGHRPVINVSWNDAVEYAAWLSSETGKAYRLPSEAEWEYAARSGGKEEKWAGTSREQELGEYAWYRANSLGMTHPVGGKKPNGLGLYDMSGNVFEWVQDWWNENYAGAPSDGRAWSQGDDGQRVMRGGSWDNIPVYSRASFRGRGVAVGRVNSVGFRLAQDIP